MNPSIVFNPGGSSFKVSTEFAVKVSLKDAIATSPAFQGTIPRCIADIKLLSNPRLAHYCIHNGFAEAILVAHERLHGLTLTPDQILVAVVQALSIHTAQDKKHLDRLWRFPDTLNTAKAFEDQDFGICGPIQDWVGVIYDFGDITAINIRPEISKMMRLGFTTTNRASKTAVTLSAVGVYHSLSHYVEVCDGTVPEIELLGTLNDWQQLRLRVEQLLSQFEGTAFWKDPLLGVLDHFVAAAEGNPDLSHWIQMVKVKGANQSPLISGWMNVFFPYLHTYEGFRKNPHINWNQTSISLGTWSHQIPYGFINEQFPWFINGLIIPMKVVVGFLGVEAYKTYNVTPSLQWAVLHKNC
ncbi:hypothetical protein DSO57_1021161 [Entomophthora muscae]|uniref:Uncharacterized protein n=1 Tax=Entomophthora muscae TaxID=34485 RepID=A0ACC2TQG2_9FUNG|nr:hypothetical protein DSO57_1021161 [Entomophthora muscae]